MDWKEFFKAAGIRAIRTIAQTALAMIPVGVMINEVNWLAVAGTAALAGVCSILTSLVTGLPEVDTDKGHVTVLAYENYDENGDPIADEFQTEVDRREGE